MDEEGRRGTKEITAKLIGILMCVLLCMVLRKNAHVVSAPPERLLG